MSGKQEKKSFPWILITVMIVLTAGGVYIVKTVLSENEPRRKDTTATVTLLKPPPPVQVREKPPEIKEVPKENIIDPGVKNETQNQNAGSKDNTQAGDNLGVDTEGGAGSDSFGLVGKKGGRSIIAGGSGVGNLSLLTRFSAYTQIVTTEIRKKVMKRLDEKGGIPTGKLQAVVRIKVDIDGKVTDYQIIGSSGNNRVDDAVIQSLRSLRISEPPPEGMPRTMNIRIISQG
ncbi:MAG TPA: TonB family protein [Nitrospirota bacterium]|nr:TonB family protein [Nitrospirota bacterium]